MPTRDFESYGPSCIFGLYRPPEKVKCTFRMRRAATTATLTLQNHTNMPRQAHGRSLLASGLTKQRESKPAKGRGLNALETAEREFPEQVKIRQHRLGEAASDDDESNTRADADERSAKRRKVDHNADEEEEDRGSDLEGNQWHVGVEEDDDDSDIDSDEAFGESDEERFADFTFRGSSKPEGGKVKQRNVKSKEKTLDLGEDEFDPDDDDDENYHQDEDMSDEDSLGDEAIDLAAAWDMDDEEQRIEQDKSAKKTDKKPQGQDRKEVDSSNQSVESAPDDDSDESEAEDEDDFGGFEVSEDEYDEEANTRLRSFVDGLTPAEKAEATKQRPTRNLPDKPSQFALPSAQISAADLMQYVTDPIQRQSLKILQQAEREDGTHHKGGIPGKLAAPLAKRQQDRLDRVAAYDQTKQTLERWVDTVKNNRRAEHVSFPLVDTTKASASGMKSLRPVLAGQPQNELEAKIQEIMQESGYNLSNGQKGEDDEQKYEELKEKQIPLEEVQARRRELRMQRELMFREEIRAKRIKKIKSKAYRRVHRKDKDKEYIKNYERGALDSDEERERADKQRAEERMGARHKESRWAKAAKATGQTTWNEDAKSGVNGMARRDDELRRRIEGKNIRGSDESGDESDSESDYESDADNDARWNEKLDSLQASAETTGKSRLADMAFMKKAEAERRAQNDEEIKQLRRATNGDEEVSGSDSDAEEQPSRLQFGKQVAKKTTTAPPPANRLDFEERLSDEEDGVLQVDDAEIVPAASSNINGAVSNKSQPAFVLREATPLPKTVNGKSKSQSSAAEADAEPRKLALDDYTSSEASEGEEDDLEAAKTKLAIDVFAGDDETDLIDAFKKEKKQIEKEEGDQVIDNTLPGWGSWTGAGVSRKAQNKAKGRFMTTIKGIAPEARKDVKLDRVIINEKRNKKNGKYLAQELPHPFESRSQYERSLRLPMGPEWSTRNHFQDAIKPRVLVKQGQVIKPMAKPIA